MNLNKEIISNYDASETESTEEREETYDTPDDDVEVIDSQPMKSGETCDTPRGIINEDDDLHEEKSTSSSTEDVRIESEVKRGPGRPKKVKTGKPGRPKRLFHEAANCATSKYEDPTSVEDMLSRTDKQL
ncbi:unnamed protein product [Lasius platythorax]|uniref:Uncharacterized protein n=1 Tax=Lasius platythorax TaxID=488582 RepID=A0AAV2MYF2_9HYME